MDLPKVTIQIVTWNSMKYLPTCLKAIFDQSYKDFQVLVIDNNSMDETVDFIRKNYPEVAIFQNKKNMGFAKANNQGIKLLHSPYVLLCNPDIILEPDWLEKIMTNIESGEYSNIGSFGGKLLKLKLIDGNIEAESKTDIIDSCGLKIFKNRRIVEIEAGESSDKFNKEREVFGHSGALVLYRRRALEDCLIKTKSNPSGEYFDEDFFFYKEDIDLAWRMQMFGWKSIFIPEAIAYHVRSSSGSEKTSISDIIRNRKHQSDIGRYYSYRNHLLMLLKNDFTKNVFRDFWRIKFLEIKKFLYVLFFETKNIKALFEVISLTPRMLAKRKEILKRTKVDYNYIARFIK